MPWNYCKNRIIEELQVLVRQQVISGYSCAFLDKEKYDCLYGGVQGCIPLYNERKIEKGMLYDLASLTKVVGTTTRILQLLESGVIHEYTLVKDILPEFIDEQITIKDLMFHCSGLPSDLQNKDHLNKENIRSILFQVKTDKSQKGRMVYSDIGFAMLGFIIERIDGSLEEGCKKNIFDPLGMLHTSWIQTEEVNKYIPTEITKDRGCICGETHDRKASLLKQSGTAGLFSTLEDLVLFVHAILCEDSVLFNKATYHRLKEDMIQQRTWGWEKPYGRHVLYHTGFTGTSILINLENNRGMILLTNRVHPTRDNQQFLIERERLNKIFLEAMK